MFIFNNFRTRYMWCHRLNLITHSNCMESFSVVFFALFSVCENEWHLNIWLFFCIVLINLNQNDRDFGMFLNDFVVCYCIHLKCAIYREFFLSFFLLFSNKFWVFLHQFWAPFTFVYWFRMRDRVNVVFWWKRLPSIRTSGACERRRRRQRLQCLQ